MQRFNEGFLLGAATAAHQVEGNNTFSDCWALEQMPHSDFTEPSGDADDHYHRFDEDIALLADAGLNMYRFSIEWARVEPQEGHFDEDAIRHYGRVLDSCVSHGVTPVVTLHHFSSPAWLIAKGGWEAESTVDDFARYVRFVMDRLGSRMQYVCTINEANMGIQVTKLADRYRRQMMSAMAGGAPAEGQVQMGLNIQKMLAGQEAAKSEKKALFGTENPATFTSPRSAESDDIVMNAHTAAVKIIRESFPSISVGLSLSLHDIQHVAGGEEAAAAEWDEEFRHYLPVIEHDDFVGVQNYTRTVFGPDGVIDPGKEATLTQMGYEDYPQALEHVIRAVGKDFHGKLFVTENGIATGDDAQRVDFIDRALAGVQACINDGLPVVGYAYWSLLDNFEWQKGFAMTFGLIAVDRSTMRRQPKSSLAHLGGYAPVKGDVR